VPRLILKHLSFYLLGLAVLAGLGAAQTPAESPAAGDSTPTLKPRPPKARLTVNIGDLLDISVYDQPDMAQKLRVNENGEISLPLLGMVPVAGLSSDEVEAKIEKGLSDGKYVKDPHVSVLVVEYATQGLSIGGEVRKPGVYPIHGPRRLQDMIDEAGGLTEKAGDKVTITRRAEPDKPLVISLSKDPSKVLENNVEIYPGDTIVVSTAGLVYVVGDVGRPGGFPMERNEQVTVLQAMALAEGAKPTAALGKAKIVRRENGDLKEIPVNLKAMLSGKIPDRVLEDKDVLFIPNSLAKSAARRSLEAVVQAAVGVTIYHPPY